MYYLIVIIIRLVRVRGPGSFSVAAVLGCGTRCHLRCVWWTVIRVVVGIIHILIPYQQKHV